MSWEDHYIKSKVYNQNVYFDIMEVSGVASDAAKQYLISALEATSDLLPKGVDRTAVVVALIAAASRYEAAMFELIGVQQTIEAHEAKVTA